MYAAKSHNHSKQKERNEIVSVVFLSIYNGIVQRRKAIEGSPQSCNEGQMSNSFLFHQSLIIQFHKKLVRRIVLSSFSAILCDSVP